MTIHEHLGHRNLICILLSLGNLMWNWIVHEMYLYVYDSKKFWWHDSQQIGRDYLFPSSLTNSTFWLSRLLACMVCLSIQQERNIASYQFLWFLLFHSSLIFKKRKKERKHFQVLFCWCQCLFKLKLFSFKVEKISCKRLLWT